MGPHPWVSAGSEKLHKPCFHGSISLDSNRSTREGFSAAPARKPLGKRDKRARNSEGMREGRAFTGDSQRGVRALTNLLYEHGFRSGRAEEEL